MVLTVNDPRPGEGTKRVTAAHGWKRFQYSLRVLLSWARLELLALVAPLRRTHRRTRDRSLVLLADQLPPIVTGGTYRPLSFIRYASRNGWRVTAFSDVAETVSPVGRQLEQAIPDDVEVVRVKQDLPQMPRIASLELDGGIANAVKLVNAVLASRPEVNLVLASGPRFHVFVAGYFLKKILGIGLVLDCRDEWSLCPFDFVDHGQLNAWWESRCLRAADLVVFTTSSTRSYAVSQLPALRSVRTCVVPNGTEDEDREFQGRSDALAFIEQDGRFTITFAGALGQHTDPAPFMRTLNAVLARRPDLRSRVRVLLIGRKSPAQEAMIGSLDQFGVCKSFGQLSQAEVRAVMQRSSLLLLITNENMDRYRPGKLYSYITTDRPILVFGGDGEAGEIVRELNAGCAIRESDDAALETVVSNASVPTAESISVRQRWTERHSREALAAELFKELDSLVS